MPELEAAHAAADRAPTGRNSPHQGMHSVVEPSPAAGATGQLQLQPCSATFEEAAIEGASSSDVPYQQVLQATAQRSLEHRNTQVAASGAACKPLPATTAVAM
jgi:hypothetical protein